MKPTLSIVSILFGGSEVLRATLPSWRAAIHNGIEVIFIDHSPVPLDDELNVSEWAMYHWVPSNPGFAAGVNRGFAEAQADRVLLLNPDVFLTAPDLMKVEAHEDDNPAAVSLRTNGVIHSGIEYSWWGFCKDRTDRRRQLLGPSGGAALVTRALVQRIPFPEHLFAWGEDAEWSLLLYSQGIRTSELPDVVLEHTGGHSVGSPEGQRLKARLLVRNRIATFRRAFAPRAKLIVGPAFAAALLLNCLRKWRQGTLNAYLAGVVEGINMPVPAFRTQRLTWGQWRGMTKSVGQDA